jgi:hypothetical protein
MREIGSVPPQMDVREAVFIAASIARFTAAEHFFSRREEARRAE